jgi:hypothetical protein
MINQSGATRHLAPTESTEGATAQPSPTTSTSATSKTTERSPSTPRHVTPPATDTHCSPDEIAREHAELDGLRFLAGDYSDILTGSGAEKLARSGVAPLVAAARGYSTIDATNFVEVMKTVNIGISTVQGRRLRSALTRYGNDGMKIPWYSLADAQVASQGSIERSPFTHQIRPGRPALNESGTAREYELVSGEVTPLDVHPAVPAKWIDKAPVVLITEGLIAGDAALTLYLQKHGASWDSLQDATEGAAARLAVLLDNVPKAERVLIVAVASLTPTAQTRVDWRNTVLRGREAWLALAPGFELNLRTWRAAARMWQELGDVDKVKSVRLLVPVSRAVVDEPVGRDALLAPLGTWDDLVRQLSAELPPAPAGTVAEADGVWRITDKGTSAEVCTMVRGDGAPEIFWRNVYPLGGRIAKTTTRRMPSDNEIRTGKLETNVHPAQIESSEVEIEVSWDRPGGTTETVTVVGPVVILQELPDRWQSRGAKIPFALLSHPAWPPRYTSQQGEKWLSAIKANRADEIVEQVMWARMGWVPVGGSSPVFVLGDQVIGQDVLGNTMSGVTEHDVSGASEFGVGDDVPVGEFTNEEYRADVRRNFEAVLDAYVRNKPFTDASTTALVLAGALRPVVPLRPKGTIYFFGPKESGKTFAARRMMAFWARYPESWMEKLTGSAKDTVTYIENAISLTPIWVADDLAPSPVKAQAESENAKMTDLVRAIFNNTAKGRMYANMTAQKTRMPIAQFIITAENELTIPSAKERLVSARFGPGKLNKSDHVLQHLVDIATKERIPARFTAHLINFVVYSASRFDGGWEAYVADLTARRSQTERRVELMLRERGVHKGSLKRVSSLAADLITPLELLRELAVAIGSDAATVALFEDRAMIGDLVDGVHIGHVDNQQSSPGQSTLRALRALLKSGGAHIINGEKPAKPPLNTGADSDDLRNHSLGWQVNPNQPGTMKPSGTPIGVLGNSAEHGALVVFYEDVAFNEAQEAFPGMIMYGQQASIAWSSMWDEGLTPPGLNRGKDNSPTWKSPVGTGVPILLATLMDEEDSTIADGADARPQT